MKRIVVFALVLNAALLCVIAQQLVAIVGGDPEWGCQWGWRP